VADTVALELVEPDYNLVNFLERTNRLVTTLSLFVALTVFARGATPDEFAYALSFLSLAITGILYLDLRFHFPENLRPFSIASRLRFLRANPRNSLGLFSVGLDLLFVTLTAYSVYTYWYVWIPLGITAAALIAVALVRKRVRRAGWSIRALAKRASKQSTMTFQVLIGILSTLSTVITLVSFLSLQNFALRLTQWAFDFPSSFSNSADLISFASAGAGAILGCIAIIYSYNGMRRSERMNVDELERFALEARKRQEEIDRRLYEERRQYLRRQYEWRPGDNQWAIATAGRLASIKDLLGSPALDDQAKFGLRRFVEDVVGAFAHQEPPVTNITLLRLPNGTYEVRATFDDST